VIEKEKIEEIKRRTDIVDVIAQFLPLKKVGKNSGPFVRSTRRRRRHSTSTRKRVSTIASAARRAATPSVF